MSLIDERNVRSRGVASRLDAVREREIEFLGKTVSVYAYAA